MQSLEEFAFGGNYYYSCPRCHSSTALTTDSVEVKIDKYGDLSLQYTSLMGGEEIYCSKCGYSGSTQDFETHNPKNRDDIDDMDYIDDIE